MTSGLFRFPCPCIPAMRRRTRKIVLELRARSRLRTRWATLMCPDDLVQVLVREPDSAPVAEVPDLVRSHLLLEPLVADVQALSGGPHVVRERFDDSSRHSLSSVGLGGRTPRGWWSNPYANMYNPFYRGVGRLSDRP